jgi:hypothetical protein
LGEQSAIHECHREICVRLSLDRDATVDDVISDRQMLQADLEVATLA